MKLLNKQICQSLLICLSVLLMTTFPSYSQGDDTDSNNRVLSLDECINIAMENSPVVMQAKEDIEISRAKLAEARSGYFPTVHARASYNYFNTNNIIKTPFPQDLISTLSEVAANQALRQQAMVSGRNPISGSAITELDVLAALAARNMTTPTNMYNRLTGIAEQGIIDSGNNILWTPILGNNYFKTEVTFQQPVFLWGKVYNLNKQAKAGIGASRSDLSKTKHEVTFEVIERYNQVLLAKDGVELARETETKFSTLRDLIEALYKGEAENVTKLDYLEVEAYLGLVRSKLYEVEKSLELSKAALRQSMGLDDQVQVDVVDNTQTYQFEDVNLDDSIQKALLNRPEFTKLEYGITAKKHEIKATKADHRPKVLIDSAFDVNVDNKNYLEPDPVDFRFSVIADIPLFDGLKTRARVNQRKHELEKLKQGRVQLKNGVTLQVIDAVLTLQETKKTLLATEEATKSAVENQSLARQSFELEIVESKKVVDAQVLEAKVKTQRLLAIFNYNVAKARLKKVMGLIETLSSHNSFEVEDLQDNFDNFQPTNDSLFLLEKPESIL